MKTLKLSALIIILAITFTSCEHDKLYVKGNNDVEIQTRSISSYDQVNLEGSLDIRLIESSISQVVIEAESNFFDHIKTKKNGSSLKIYTRSKLDRNHPIKIDVYCSDIDKLTVDGSGKIYCDSLNSNNIDVTVNGSGQIRSGIWADDINCNIFGSGDIELWGEADESELCVSGSGEIHAYDLIQDICYAKILGSGKIFVWVDDILDVEISGSGKVYYKGSPNVYKDINGSGSVIQN